MREKNMMNEVSIAAISLIILMLLTPLANAYMIGNIFQQHRTLTQYSTKTAEVYVRKSNL